jgi:hypothetical protein
MHSPGRLIVAPLFALALAPPPPAAQLAQTTVPAAPTIAGAKLRKAERPSGQYLRARQECADASAITGPRT